MPAQYVQSKSQGDRGLRTCGGLLGTAGLLRGRGGQRNALKRLYCGPSPNSPGLNGRDSFGGIVALTAEAAVQTTGRCRKTLCTALRVRQKTGFPAS